MIRRRSKGKCKYAIPGMTLNATWEVIMKFNGLPAARRECRFDAKRKWRFDFFWPEYRLAVEIEGGVFMKGSGAHGTGLAMTKDCEKYNAAALAGIMVLRFTNKTLEDDSGYAIRTIRQAIVQRMPPGEAKF